MHLATVLIYAIVVMWLILKAGAGAFVARALRIHSQKIATELGYTAIQFNLLSPLIESLSIYGKNWVVRLSAPYLRPINIKNWD
ncbi:MAG: hypothetical protein ACJA0C_000977 [Candidatus Endobugula sp.]|jgi:hypothetical protein